MYNLKQIPILFLSLSLFVVGCTTEKVTEDLNEVSSEDNPVVKRVDYPDVDSYLDTKYTNGYTFGFERTFTEDDDTYIVKEVFENGATEVTGFVNLTNNDFTQYIELERSRDLVYIDDFIDDVIYEFDAIEEDSQDLFLEGFLENFDQPVTLSSGRFWGWSCGKSYSIEPGSCYRTCYYYVVWNRIDSLQASEGSQDHPVYGCDNLPGNNPKLPQVNPN